MTEVQFRLLFEAGRVAEERGWSDAQVVSADALEEQSPAGPPIVVALSSSDASAQTAKTVSALAGAGRRVLLVTDQPLPADVAAWLPADSWVVTQAQPVPTGVEASDDHRHELRAELLESLLTGPEASDVAEYLAGDPKTPQRILAGLATCNNEGGWTAYYLAGNPSAPREFLDQLLDRDDREWPESLAGNSALPLPKRHDIMRRVARSKVKEWQDQDSFDNDFADLNVMTDVPRDVFMIFDEAGYLFGEWIYSESIPEDLLLGIFNSGGTEPYQERGFASRSSTPDGVLRALAASENPWTRKWAAMPSDAPADVLMSLAADASEYGEYVRVWVAENPSTPVEALVRLLNDPDESVRSAAAMNPSLPVQLAQSREHEILGGFALEERIDMNRVSRHALGILAGQADAEVRRAVAMCPTTPYEAVLALADDADAGVRWGVARNPNAPASLRAQILHTEIDTNGGSTGRSYLARDIAGSEHCPAEVLEVLARDSAPLVRAAVVVNPATPSSVLETMTIDSGLLEHSVPALAVDGTAARGPDPTASCQTQDPAVSPGPGTLLDAPAGGGPEDFEPESQPTPRPTRECLVDDAEAARLRLEIDAAMAALDPTTAMQLASATTSRRVLARMASDVREVVRIAAASSPHAQPDLLEALSRDSSDSVRRCVAGNPLCSDSTLTALTSDYAAVIAGNPAASSETLRRAMIRTCGRVLGLVT